MITGPDDGLVTPALYDPTDDLVRFWEEPPTGPAPLRLLQPGDAATFEALKELEPTGPRPWRSKGKIEKPRDKQRPPPGDWSTWLLMCGRGFGKTFTGANTLADWAVANKGDYAVVAPTFGDARKICVEGPSGLLQALGDELESYNKSEFILYLKNGSRIVLASADAPDRLRGWNLSGAWVDEVGSYKNPEVWYDALDFALREGDPRIVATTTPRRGNVILLDLLKQEKEGSTDVVVTRGHTMENADNLSAKALQRLDARYAGTTLGRQELGGEMLNEVEGALVTGSLVEATRVRAPEVPTDNDGVPMFWRIAVAVDPAVSNKPGSDETGIVVAAIGPAPIGWQPPAGRMVLAGQPHLYFLDDVSARLAVDAWARRCLNVAADWAADVIVAESNQGGDLVESNVRLIASGEGMLIPDVHQVHASVGKRARAEPIAGLWEQYRVHIVGTLPRLEDQWCGWVPLDEPKSPDRLDASVWAAVELFPELATKGGTIVEMWGEVG